MSGRAVGRFGIGWAMLVALLLTLGSATALADGPGEHSEGLIDRVLGKRAEHRPDGLFEVPVRGPDLTTHGPDVRPAGADPRPDGFEPGDAERDPVCGGSHYQHVLYAHPAGSVDRSAETLETIRAAIRRMNAVLHRDAISSGERSADYRVLCDPDGEILVDSFTAEGATFSKIVNAARLAGFDDPDVDYTIFFDESAGACGVGSYIDDDRPGEENLNNRGGSYGITYRGCWLGDTPMHENGHNQGAVQYDAPYSTGSGGHCWDVRDVLCYSPDGGDRHQEGTILRCADRTHFDCGYDTYFDAAPELGEWLASHWNLGSPANRFIAFGPAESEPPNASPTAGFDVSCTSLECAFADRSEDLDGAIVSRSWRFGDGDQAAGPTPRHSYREPGNYEVELTVTDDDGASATLSRAVAVTGPEPPPAEPPPSAPAPPSAPVDPAPIATPELEPIRLRNRSAVRSRAPRSGEWRLYELAVPSRRRLLRVKLVGRGDSRAPLLFVRHRARPTRRLFDCARRRRAQDRKVCNLKRPRRGRWLIGVLGSSEAPDAFRLRVVHRKRR